MRKSKKDRWFTTRAWETLTEEEKQTQQLREEFYQLAVHYVIENETPTVTASMIKRLYVPMGVGTWKMAPSYEAAKEVLERMVNESILTKVNRAVDGAPELYFYEISAKKAPFELSESLQHVLAEVQEKEQKRWLPGQLLQEAVLSWVKEITGQTKLTAPYEVKFVGVEGESYGYEILKDQKPLGRQIFNVRDLIKQEKLA